MLLILGIPSESPVKYLTNACDTLQLPYTMFNQRNQQNWNVDVDYVNFDNSIIGNGEAKFRIGDFTGIYVRAMDYTQVPEYEQLADKTVIEQMYTRFFMLIDNVESPRVANKPAPMLSNNSKPYQSMIITQYGLQVPDTCITNNKEEAQDFINSYDSVIYKSISGTRSIVKQIDENSAHQLEKILYCPVQFQECVIGTNVRVHVINETVIATKINSDAVDYRYAHTEDKHTDLEPMVLSTDIENRCIQLSKALQLPFSGIDLMLTKDGRTICFEINPSPGYSYYESNTGQLISYALANYLSKIK